jgi:hypothetical protein
MPVKIIPVIMCGGAGTRLWPVSRESMPKQFVPLIGQGSTFQQVMTRVSDRSATQWRFLLCTRSKHLSKNPMRRRLRNTLRTNISGTAAISFSPLDDTRGTVDRSADEARRYRRYHRQATRAAQGACLGCCRGGRRSVAVLEEIDSEGAELLKHRSSPPRPSKKPSAWLVRAMHKKPLLFAPSAQLSRRRLALLFVR